MDFNYNMSRYFDVCTQLVFGTPHFQRLVKYLIEKDQLEHLVVTTLRAKRYKFVCIFTVGWALYGVFL